MLQKQPDTREPKEEVFEIQQLKLMIRKMSHKRCSTLMTLEKINSDLFLCLQFKKTKKNRPIDNQMRSIKNRNYSLSIENQGVTLSIKNHATASKLSYCHMGINTERYANSLKRSMKAYKGIIHQLVKKKGLTKTNKRKSLYKTLSKTYFISRLMIVSMVPVCLNHKKGFIIIISG